MSNPLILTDIDVGLVSLKGCGHSSHSRPIASENMVDRIESCRSLQRGPARAEKVREGSKARHYDKIPSTQQIWLNNGEMDSLGLLEIFLSREEHGLRFSGLYA